MKVPITELDTLTETDRLIRCRERLEEFHIEMQDFERALQDKWAIVNLTLMGHNQTKGANNEN